MSRANGEAILYYRDIVEACRFGRTMSQGVLMLLQREGAPVDGSVFFRTDSATRWSMRVISMHSGALRYSWSSLKNSSRRIS